MIVPFSISDFIDRAVSVYGERTGVIDEPDQPAPSLGELTYAEIGALARRQAAKLDELGIGVGDRVAVVSHNSARLLTSFFGVAGLRPGAGAGQLPAPARRGGLHRRALRGQGAAGRSRARRRSGGHQGGVPLRPRRRRQPVRTRGRRAEGVGAGRERHRVHQLHLRHDRPAQGRPDHPPQHLGQRGDVRSAHRRQRPRRLPAHAADVPRQRLGDAVHDDRAGRSAGRDPQDRRRRDPAPGREVRRHRDVRGTGRRRRRTRGRPGLGGRHPGQGPDPDHHGRRPAAHEDRSPGRGGARLGVRPDLRPHRDLAAAHRQPQPRRVGRTVGSRSGPRTWCGPGCPRSACGSPIDGEGRGAGPVQRGARGLLGPARGVREGARRGAGSTPATAA